ncbi:hypothetical protein [Pseudonocardia acaciae]|uniref:hypothetical protein n=1 Tax=Pseudonocardia acaciae TaxID=551276 RepID=UPI00048DD56B|nr:hypothetical protein [Pseudonocardia acaciae]
MASSALKRGVTVMLEGLGMHLWGFPPNLMAPIVIQLGPLRAAGWFVWNMPRYERTLRAFGPVRTHLICTAISLVNGCRYCTYGHGLALEYAYLREYRRLFPLSEETIGGLRGLPPGVIRHHMVHAMQRAGLHTEVRWLERAIELTVAEDRRPTDEDDVRISHLVRMFGVLNSVGIADATEPDQAHSPLNKDAALKTRYARLRAASGA